MEHEFDKEIDALLRKTPWPPRSPAEGHLDADVLAAFAENALPEASRSEFVTHLADCDRCRSLLARTVGPIGSVIEPVPSSTAAAPAAVSREREPMSILQAPRLVLVMGSLFAIFAALFAFSLMRGVTDNISSVAKVDEQNAVQSNSAAPTPEASIAAAVPANSTNTIAAASTPETATSPSSKPEAETSGARIAREVEIAQARPDERQVTVTANGGSGANVPSVTAPSAVPPPRPSAAAPADRDDERLKAAAESTVDEPANAEKPMNADGATLSAKRAAPPSGTRSVGGKSFSLRGGVWYDTAYKGGAATEVKRGSDKFAQLDEGLRSIANQISGTVVVVWSGRAYKIK
ncbi:MAG: zf-HC2 domain-containing protein [Acidobacteria bacterium]|nr:zf-HC2 domain-containing protein [Acidobacteriota bacterium]